MNGTRLFLYYIWNAFLGFFKYIFACSLLVLGSMVLLTGRFPPPVTDLYKSVTRFQSSMDIGKNMAQFAKAQEERRSLMEELEREEAISDGRAPASTTTGKPGRPAGEPAFDPYERIKVLEYEVAYLKSKLARAEWEVNNLKTRQAPPK